MLAGYIVTEPAEEVGDLWLEAAKEELRVLMDDLLHTEKTHMAAAERLQADYTRAGSAATVLSALAAGTIVSKLSPVLGGLFALGAAIVSGVLTFNKPERAAQQHLAAGRQLAELRVRVRQALNLDVARMPQDEARAMIAALASEKQAADGSAPGTKQKDYNVARSKIVAGTFARDP